MKKIFFILFLNFNVLWSIGSRSHAAECNQTATSHLEAMHLIALEQKQKIKLERVEELNDLLLTDSGKIVLYYNSWITMKQQKFASYQEAWNLKTQPAVLTMFFLNKHIFQLRKKMTLIKPWLDTLSDNPSPIQENIFITFPRRNHSSLHADLQFIFKTTLNPDQSQEWFDNQTEPELICLQNSFPRITRTYTTSKKV